MFCSQCGKQLPDDSRFCDTCGFDLIAVNDDVNMLVAESSSRPFAGQNRGRTRVALTVSILIAAAAVVAIVLFLFGKGTQTEKIIRIVRDGYLGAYTDVTIERLLETTFHTEEGNSKINWSCSQNGDKSWRVEANCSYNMDNVAVFCFQLLDEKSFKVSDIKCPGLDISTSEKQVLELNRMYFTYYLEKEDLDSLVERLSKINFGTVLYGSAAEFSHSTEEIYKQYYPYTEDISVAQALELIDERKIEDYVGTYYLPEDWYGDGTYVDFLDIEAVGLDQLRIRRQSYRITVFDVYINMPEGDIITLYDENGMRVDIIYHFDMEAIQIETADPEDPLNISGWYYINPESISPTVNDSLDFSWVEGEYHQAAYYPMTLELFFDSNRPWENGNDWYIYYSIHDEYEILRDGRAYYIGGGETPSFYGGNPNSPGSEIRFDYDGYNFVLTSDDGMFDGISFFQD